MKKTPMDKKYTVSLTGRQWDRVTHYLAAAEADGEPEAGELMNAVFRAVDPKFCEALSEELTGKSHD